MCILAFLLTSCLTQASALHNEAPSVTRLVGGRWYHADGFREETWFVVDGQLARTARFEVEREIDLEGRFVVPPFGDAHNHHLSGAGDFESDIDAYMSAGVFYLKNPNSIAKMGGVARARLNRASTPDVTFSFGGITSTGGHPVQVYRGMLAGGALPGWNESDLDGEAFHQVDDDTQLATVWPRVLAPHPDFIKVYLENAWEGTSNGLNPDALRSIVTAAREAGLPISAHVLSAHDFRLAAETGVNEINHLPLERLRPIDVAAAVEHDVSVVTTVTSHRRPSTRMLDEIHAHNLRLLSEAGVRLLIGTDDHLHLVVTEARAILRLRVLDAAAILHALVHDTPRAIFPSRRIGAFNEGYEASFLALRTNPLEDFGSLSAIDVRMKQGVLLGSPGAKRSK